MEPSKYNIPARAVEAVERQCLRGELEGMELPWMLLVGQVGKCD